MTKGTMEEIQNSYINIQELSLSLYKVFMITAHTNRTSTLTFYPAKHSKS